MVKYNPRTGCVPVRKRKAKLYNGDSYRPRNKALEKRQKLLIKAIQELQAL